MTIGRKKAYAAFSPPPYIAAFNAVKIIFLPYGSIADLFLESAHMDFSVTASNYTTGTFQKIHARLAGIIANKKTVFYFDEHEHELRKFIKDNILSGQPGKQISVTRNNLISVCNLWRREVMPSINVDWERVRRRAQCAFVESDLFMADLLASDNRTIIDGLKIKLEADHYNQREKDEDSLSGFHEVNIGFTDGMKAHNEFWKRYKRPPEDKVIQWVLERKGSFFTPRIWVEKAQEYLMRTLGENWQEEYYVWDCCAGTGNMEVGLTNKNRIFASTLDEGDAAIMREQIHDANAQLFEDHVFQFDFLNDPFFAAEDRNGNLIASKLPDALQTILRDPEQRKKLLIFINPPYAEAASRETIAGTGGNKTGVAVKTTVYKKYQHVIGIARRELFAQFFIRIHQEIPGCVLAEFSTLKILQAPTFKKFRTVFQAKQESLFLVPADTFDNVQGQFPIGFFIWDTRRPERFDTICADVYEAENGRAVPAGSKNIVCCDSRPTINDWIIATRRRTPAKIIGYMSAKGCDFQNLNTVFLISRKNLLRHPRGTEVTDKNLIEIAVYLSVRHGISKNWLNDRDQFLRLMDSWLLDRKFQANCLAFTLFARFNNIKSEFGSNHWIPFTEEQVGTTRSFTSHFMSDFIAGRILPGETDDLIGPEEHHLPPGEIIFSPEAQKVMDAGLAVWQYYFQAKKHLVTFNQNASFYDIRKTFQGVAAGRMNSTSDDSYYNDLMASLKAAQKDLRLEIIPEIYKYGFLK